MACDPFWDKTLLALKFDGTNGSTTFTDEKGHAITANGNAQISTAQSKFGGASGLFDGAGDSISLPSTDLSLPDDFTIDAWVYITSLGANQGIIDVRPSASYSNYVFNLYNVGGTLRLDFVTAGGAGARLTGASTSVPLNTWTHVAIVRFDGVIKAYVNGVADTVVVAYSSPLVPGGGTAYVGQTVDPSYLYGHIDAMRITKAARYTANFTPDTSAFATSQCVISGVVKDATNANAKRLVRILDRKSMRVLTAGLSDATTGAYSLPVETTDECLVVAHDVTSEDFYWDKVVLALKFDGTNGSTTFTDEKGHTATVGGGAQLTTTSPKFGTACGTFDGTGDYVSFPDDADLELGGGDFTIDFWMKTTQTLTYAGVLGRDNGAFPAGAWAILLNGPGSGYIQFWNSSYSTGGANLSPASSVKINDGAWHHVAVVRSGASMFLFKDGIAIATSTWVGVIADAALGINIGRDPGYSRDYNGQIDDLRITKFARWTSGFTPPAQSFSTSNAAGSGTENAVVCDRVVPG